MKNRYTLISIVFLLVFNVHAQDEMVAGWTFPGNALTADTGAAANLSQEIYTVGGTSDIELKNGFDTKAAQASGWNEGMDQKGWVAALNTQGFSNLTISSRQQSGGNDPGPKYFRLQYSTDGGSSWIDLEGGDITVENDWETAFVDQLSLPEDCENLELLMIRWLMASNEASGSGGNVQDNGKSKIDDVFIRGEIMNAVSESEIFNSIVSTGPKKGIIRIQSKKTIRSFLVSTLNGQYWFVSRPVSGPAEFELPASFSGKIVVCSFYLGSYKSRVSGKIFIP
jgi:hypothetical protein